MFDPLTAPAALRLAAALDELPPGASVKVLSLQRLTSQSVGQLMSFGLCEGSVLRVIQRRPVVVVALGATELALERKVARLIVAAPAGDACDG